MKKEKIHIVIMLYLSQISYICSTSTFSYELYSVIPHTKWYVMQTHIRSLFWKYPSEFPYELILVQCRGLLESCGVNWGSQKSRDLSPIFLCKSDRSDRKIDPSISWTFLKLSRHEIFCLPLVPIIWPILLRFWTSSATSESILLEKYSYLRKSRK